MQRRCAAMRRRGRPGLLAGRAGGRRGVGLRRRQGGVIAVVGGAQRPAAPATTAAACSTLAPPILPTLQAEACRGDACRGDGCSHLMAGWDRFCGLWAALYVAVLAYLLYRISEELPNYSSSKPKAGGAFAQLSDRGSLHLPD